MSFKKAALTRKKSIWTAFFYEIKRSWWVLFFIMLSYMVAVKNLTAKDLVIEKLEDQLSSLMHEKQSALEKQGEFLLHIQSQQDPEWIEIILMKKLGLVPSGQKKVLFKTVDLD